MPDCWFFVNNWSIINNQLSNILMYIFKVLRYDIVNFMEFLNSKNIYNF